MMDLELAAQSQKEEVERRAEGAWRHQDKMDKRFLEKVMRRLRTKRRKRLLNPIYKTPLLL
ncbi:hypothetical protein B0X71_13650 [Planococcus lenghuensis]|uniref:Uncharacterized protein n=2 Tax=Planococcus lenghuensis TaxID=2213202 RepID=A0A1Q2L0Q2_9BACL|nr:hypothetical protein B0X71_13650 [Planococcus lenghuensis]